MQRLTFEKFAINLAESASTRSEDPFKKVGCAIFNKEGRLLSLGYNGLQPKQKIKNNFWKDRNERRKFIIHAETNALSCITRYDNPYLLVTTLLPCSTCAVNIAAFGIKKIIYTEDYAKDMLAKEIFKFYNINIRKI